MKGFPDTCGTCHGQEAWSPAAFTHTWPLVRRARDACLQRMPRRRSTGLPRHAHTLRRLPSGRLRQQPLPGPRRLPNDLRKLPHDDRLDARGWGYTPRERVPDSKWRTLSLSRRLRVLPQPGSWLTRGWRKRGLRRLSRRRAYASLDGSQASSKSPITHRVPRRPTSAWIVTRTVATRLLRTS